MKRDPFLNWLIVFITFGFFGYFWAFRIATDVAQTKDDLRYVRVRRRRFSSMLVFCVAVAFLAPLLGLLGERASSVVEWVERADLVLALGLTLYMAYFQCWLAERMRAISRASSPSGGAVFALYFLWAASLPYLQLHANRLLHDPKPA